MPTTVLSFEQMPGTSVLTPLFPPLFSSPSHPSIELPYTFSELLPSPPSHTKQTAPLFTIAKIMETSQMSIDRWMDKENVFRVCVCVCVCVCVMEGYSVLNKEGDITICDNMDEPWGHYAKWNKSVSGG